MKKKILQQQLGKIKVSKNVKTISWLTIIVSVLTISDQFLEWGIIDFLLQILDK